MFTLAQFKEANSLWVGLEYPQQEPEWRQQHLCCSVTSPTPFDLHMLAGQRTAFVILTKTGICSSTCLLKCFLNKSSAINKEKTGAEGGGKISGYQIKLILGLAGCENLGLVGLQHEGWAVCREVGQKKTTVPSLQLEPWPSIWFMWQLQKELGHPLWDCGCHIDFFDLRPWRSCWMR